MSFDTLRWRDGRLELIDQTLLPVEEVYRSYDDYREVAKAIVDMIVRGAPAIGVSAAYGLAIAARQALEAENFSSYMEEAYSVFAATRPTAVNLFWGIERMRQKASSLQDMAPSVIAAALEEEAIAIDREDVEANRAMGSYDAALLPDAVNILTHCNAGALATAGYGTALGVIRAAVEAGKRVNVYADETRPFLQGARLTSWELHEDDIPVTLICDNMAGYLMKLGKVDAVIVGADRIASNGDVANKIGTYSVALLAKAHSIPFYVSAPISTIDYAISTGEEIPIEERSHLEVTEWGGVVTAPKGIGVWNTAFDVTPAEYVTAIITDRGVATAPYGDSLLRLKG